MIKTISKIGNSQGIILDNTVMQLAHLKVGDAVNIEIHPQSRAITIMPMDTAPAPEEMTDVIEDVMKRYAQTMQRLA